jgi:hypothetical protein
MLFPRLAEGIVYEGLAKLREKTFDERQRQYDELDDWYIGGSNITQYLLKHQGEEWDEFSDRQRRLCCRRYSRECFRYRGAGRGPSWRRHGYWHRQHVTDGRCGHGRSWHRCGQPPHVSDRYWRVGDG